MKNTIVDVILTEEMNWNTLMRLVSNKQNSITLPVKVFNSVASKYLQDFREQKKHKSCNYFVIFTQIWYVKEIYFSELDEK